MTDPDATTLPSATPADARRVLLITDDMVAAGPDGPTARLASTSLRLLVALDAIQRHGQSARLVANTTPAHIEASGQIEAADVILFGKVFQDYRSLVERARAAGKTVVLDVTDDLDQHRPLAFMRALVPLADAFVVPSSAMAALVDGWTAGDRPIDRVPDPIEGRVRAVGGDLRRRPLRLVWYGSPTNAQYLLPHLPGLVEMAERRPLELTLVSTGEVLFSSLLEPYGDASGSPLRVRFVEWSLAAQAHEIERADLVLLPGDLDGESALKSANRLIAAIAAGRFCVATALPSYRAFADHALLVDSLAEGIDAACAMPPDRIARAVREGQEVVVRGFTPEVVGRRWVEVLSALKP